MNTILEKYPLTIEGNRAYLLEVVTPHLEKMSTSEESPDSTAVLNFRHYVRDRRYFALHGFTSMVGTLHRLLNGECIISDRYDCGYSACYCGWYALIGEQDDRVSVVEDLDKFSSHAIARHFGLTIGQTFALFGDHCAGIELINELDALGVDGADIVGEDGEEREYKFIVHEDMLNDENWTTERVLQARKEFLIDIINGSAKHCDVESFQV